VPRDVQQLVACDSALEGFAQGGEALGKQDGSGRMPKVAGPSNRGARYKTAETSILDLSSPTHGGSGSKGRAARQIARSLPSPTANQASRISIPATSTAKKIR